MATRQELSLSDAKVAMAERVRLAQGAQAVHTVLLVDARPAGVLVSMDWRRTAADALDEPLDPTQLPVVAVTDLRASLGPRVGTHVIVARRTKWLAALVPWDWYVRAAKALGESVNL